MLKTVEIQRFRCFETLKVHGFSRINLIGGKNNSGKTALLEALFFLTSGTALAALRIKAGRRESSEMTERMPDQAWKTFYYQQDISIPIRIKGYNENQEIRQLELSVGSLVDVSLSSVRSSIDEDFKEWIDLVASASKPPSVLSAQLITNPEPQEPKDTMLIATRKGILNLQDLSLPSPLIIFSSLRTDYNDLTEAFDRARLADLDDRVLELFQILDPEIEKIESFSIGEPNLYLKCRNKPRLPIGVFGDAISRLAEIALTIVSHKSSAIFIDEIENGLHYSNQKAFWQGLFKLCQELDVQLFATTHSLEMIKAFTQAGLNSEPDQFAYFELARHAKTQKIIAVHRDLDNLGYSLEADQGLGIRGES